MPAATLSHSLAIIDRLLMLKRWIGGSIVCVTLFTVALPTVAMQCDHICTQPESVLREAMLWNKRRPCGYRRARSSYLRLYSFLSCYGEPRSFGAQDKLKRVFSSPLDTFLWFIGFARHRLSSYLAASFIGHCFGEGKSTYRPYPRCLSARTRLHLWCFKRPNEEGIYLDS